MSADNSCAEPVSVRPTLTPPPVRTHGTRCCCWRPKDLSYPTSREFDGAAAAVRLSSASMPR